MSKPLKIVVIVILSLLVLGVLGVFISNAVIKSKIENLLQNSLPETLEIQYGDIDVSTWNGRVVLVSPKLKNFGAKTGSKNAWLEMDSLMVDGFGLWDYLVHKKIKIESIQLRQPKLTYFHNPLVDKKEYKYSKLEHLQYVIQINRVNIQKGDLTVRNFDTDSLMLKTENFTANLMGVHLDANTVKRRVPFLFDDYNVNFDHLFYQVGDYENVEVQSSKITKMESNFNNLKLYTKYSKGGLTKMIPFERDHFDVTIKSLNLKGQDFGYKQDSIFYFNSSKLEFNEPIINVYRNKLVADDSTIKSLYSKMLRELTFDLDLSEVILKNGSIKYSEKVKPESSAGELSFTTLNATIKNLGNTYQESERTDIDVEGIFMKSTPIKVNWYFDVNNVNDQFIFKAEIGKLPAQDLNPFSQPNLKVKFEGELLKTYFTVDGNAHDSNVDLRTNYDNFKVSILQKEGQEKNRFLSAIANIFIKKDSNSEPDQFRESSKKTVERDKTKSVFNFVWLNASAGLLSVLTGDGKK